MVKGRTSLYLDRDLVQKLVNGGWNISALVTETLELADKPEWEDMQVLMKINLLESRKEDIEKELAIIRLRLKSLEIENERITKSIADTKEEWELAKRTTRMQGYIQSLNRIIIASLYDVASISESAKDILPKVLELNPEFDLHTHVDKLRTIMEY